jgi:hypothetical protein
LHDGVITADPGAINIVLDNYLDPSLDFKRARVRLELKPDGQLTGLIGGYIPWMPIYHAHSVGGYVEEYALSLDLPGVYYAMKNLADGDPDPRTGQNTTISSAYAIEAVPAFAIDQATEKTTARAPANQDAVR